MIPYIYKSGTTEFGGNSEWRATYAKSCKVHQTINSDQYTLEMVIPAENIIHRAPGESVYYPVNNTIKNGMIVYCSHDNSGELEPFDVYECSDNDDGTYTVRARHVSHRLKYILAKPFEVTTGGPAQALSKMEGAIVGDCPFGFDTDCELPADHPSWKEGFLSDHLRDVQSLLLAMSNERAGTEDSTAQDLAGFGDIGFWEFHHFSCHLASYEKQMSFGTHLREGMNVRRIQSSVDTEDMITACVPFWRGHDDESGETVYVTTDDIVSVSDADLDHFITRNDNGFLLNRLSYQKTQSLDLSQMFVNKPTVQQLTDAAKAYMSSQLQNVLNTAAAYEVDLTQDTDDRDGLQSLTVGQVVTLYPRESGLATMPHAQKLRVTELTYDVLNNRVESVVLGTRRETLQTMWLRDRKKLIIEDADNQDSTDKVSKRAVTKNTLQDESKTVTNSDGSKTYYDSQGNELEVIGNINGKDVTAHKAGSGSGSGSDSDEGYKAGVIHVTDVSEGLISYQRLFNVRVPSTNIRKQWDTLEAANKDVSYTLNKDAIHVPGPTQVSIPSNAVINVMYKGSGVNTFIVAVQSTSDNIITIAETEKGPYGSGYGYILPFIGSRNDTSETIAGTKINIAGTVTRYMIRLGAISTDGTDGNGNVKVKVQYAYEYATTDDGTIWTVSTRADSSYYVKGYLSDY